MVTNTTIEGRQIGADGVWIPAEGQVEPESSSIDLSTPYIFRNAEGFKGNHHSVISQGKTANREKWNNADRLVGKGSYMRSDTNGQYMLLAGTVAPSTTFSNDMMGRLRCTGTTTGAVHIARHPLRRASHHLCGGRGGTEPSARGVFAGEGQRLG